MSGDTRSEHIVHHSPTAHNTTTYINNGGYVVTETGVVTALLGYIVNVYIDSLLCVFGMVGNVLVLCVLHKDRSPTSNKVFLRAIAVYDLIILTFTVLYTTLRSVYPATGDLRKYYEQSCYIIAYALPIAWTAQTGTIWFTTLAAADRYLAVTRPLQAASVCSATNGKRVTLAVSALALVFNIPRFFNYHLVAFYTHQNATFVSHIIVEDLPGWNSQVYQYLYHIGLGFVFLYIIPLSALIFFNVRLIVTLRAGSKARGELQATSRYQAKQPKTNYITLNIVVVITKLILCETPDFAAAVKGALPVEVGTDNYAVFSIIKEMLLVLNSAVNFYIYWIFNHKFRGILMSMCYRRTGRESHGVNSSGKNLRLSRLQVEHSMEPGRIKTHEKNSNVSCMEVELDGIRQDSFESHHM